MRQCWANPNPPSGSYASRQDTVLVDSSIAPVRSPAPAGNPVVPAGWVRQIGSDREIDTNLADTRSGATIYQARIYQWVVPYVTGGWPRDPLFGQPGHQLSPPVV